MELVYQNKIHRKERLVVFHPALAPYRLDFFNSLNQSYDASFYFLYMNALEQSFNQEELRNKLSFSPHYMSAGLFGMKNLRIEFFSILNKIKPDIVFCSEYNILGVLILLYKYFCHPQLKVFTICDDNKEMAEKVSRKKRWVRSWMIKRLDGVILANEAVVSWYREHYPHEKKYIYFPIVQNDDRYRKELFESLPLSHSLSIKYNLINKHILLYVGRLATVKNLLFLIQALQKIVERYPSVVLLLVGDGDEQVRIIEEVERLKLKNNLLFIGKKQGNELLAYYNLGQLFVLPSIYEPFGAVVNEALLAGCYTLCSELAGAAGLIKEGENGALFSPSSINELVSKMEIALQYNAPFEKAELKANRMVFRYKDYYSSFYNKIQGIK